MKELALEECVSRRWITGAEGLEDKDETTWCTPLLSHAFLGDVEVTERLLHTMLPAPIARELKQNGHVKPVLHEQATVLFADLVGFTDIASRLSPESLLEELDLDSPDKNRAAAKPAGQVILRCLLCTP